MSENNGLKGFSKKFRDRLLGYKLQTPPDIVKSMSGVELSNEYENYLASIGNDGVISDHANSDPGSIDDFSNERAKLLGKNKIPSGTLLDKMDDISSSDLSYANYLDSINQPIELSDYKNSVAETMDEQSIHRNKMLNLNQTTPIDIIEGMKILGESESAVSGYLDSINKPVVLVSMNVQDPGDVEDHSVYRTKILSMNEKTPIEIINGVKLLSQSDSETINYLDGLNRATIIGTSNVVNPGNVDDHSVHRENVLRKNIKTPNDVIGNFRKLTESETILNNYLDGINREIVISDYNVTNPGSVDDNNVIREQLLKQNQAIPSDIIIGLNELSESQLIAKSYTDNINEPIVLTAKSVKDPGKIDDDAKYREKILARNQKIQSDVLAGLTNVSLTIPAVRSYIDSINKQTVISDLVIKNPGEISTYGNQQLITNLSRNKKISQNDVSEGGSSLVDSSINSITYRNWLYDIANEAKIGDYFVINQPDLDDTSIKDTKSGIMIDEMLQQLSQKNRYTPENGFKIFDETIQSLQNTLKQREPGFWSESNLLSFIPRNYTPTDFVLNLQNISDPTSEFNFNDTLSQTAYINSNLTDLINNGGRMFKDDSLLMNIGALELLYNFGARVTQEIKRETILKTNIDEALTNPLVGVGILRGDIPFFERDYTISKSTKLISRAYDFISRLTGTASTPELFGVGDFFKNETPLLPQRPTRKASVLKDNETDEENWLLKRTGSGQKYQLFTNISYNKYRPDYPNVKKFIKGVDQTTPNGNYYIGDKSAGNVVNILQQADGFYQEHSNEKLTDAFATNYNKAENNGADYSGENLVKIGGYGILGSEFVWVDEKTFTGIDRTKLNLNQTEFSYNKRDTFRDGSLLDFTQKLVEKNNIVSQTINQLNRKFTDGFTTMSRGSAIKGYEDLRDENGARRYSAMLQRGGEYCRVWTKDKPYGNITTMVRFGELIRRERNSVLDRYGNLNIFPSKLNVNHGYGSETSTMDINGQKKQLTTEFYGERRARKYMFSIENLAWVGSELERNLPPSERGPNGGRVMWFPPYELKMIENNNQSVNSTNFLGRPEPVYTYSNTERTGNLNFKIIVDHPTILNLLVQTELSKLSDTEVDNILDAFWSGCINFDIFDLAKLWGVFSVDELEYFKSVISVINKGESNVDVIGKVNKIRGISTEVQPTNIPANSVDIAVAAAQNILIDSYVYFQNNVPLNNVAFADVLPYSNYFNEYISLLDNSSGVDHGVKYYDKAGNVKNFVEHYKLALNTQDNLLDNVNFKAHIQQKYNEMSESWKNLINGNVGNNIEAKFETFASPIGLASFNKDLALKRFISVTKELILLTKNATVDSNGNTAVTKDNVGICFDKSHTSAVFYKPSTKSSVFDKVVIKAIDYREITLFDQSNKVVPYQPITDPDTQIKYYAFNYTLPTGGTCEIRVVEPDKNAADAESDVNLNKYFNSIKDESGNYTKNGHKLIVLSDNLSDDCVALASFTGKYGGKYREASLVASIVGPVASVSRCGHLSSITTQKNTLLKESNDTVTNEILTPSTKTNVITNEVNGDVSTITKRDIAIRILNKLITEEDYFNYLDERYPGAFNSIREKLRYFSPSFHSMTPEGLNGRLTFLLQCLRPGSTITYGDKECDANNTAFGRPPICVLRIGDFYHSKIIIDNINLDYEPLIFDLNPEGVGVQPMIANVSMSFKFIGGQGLRKAVEELQNALSFNYFANTEIYDDRSFANTDEFERALSNYETSFFDTNELDIQRIVDNAQKIKNSETPNSVPSGTIGEEIGIGTNLTASQTNTPFEFVANVAYKPKDLVFYGFTGDKPIVWKCIKTTEGAVDDITPMDDSLYWEKDTNYSGVDSTSANNISTYEESLLPTVGLYPYQVDTVNDVSNRYVDYRKLSYRRVFEEFYESLGLLYRRKINKYKDLSNKFGEFGLNNPFIVGGILMHKPMGVLMENALYGHEKCDTLLHRILGAPQYENNEGEPISEFVFPVRTTKNTPTTSSYIISAVDNKVHIKPSIGDNFANAGQDGLYYYPNYMSLDEYYQFGIENNPINGKKQPQLMLLHLYPQDGNYKLPSASDALTDEILNNFSTYADQSKYYAKLDKTLTQFIPNSFSDLLIPKPVDSENIINVIGFFKKPVQDLINSKNLSILRRNLKTGRDDYSLTSALYKSSQIEISKLTDRLVDNFNKNLSMFIEGYREYASFDESIKSQDILSKISNLSTNIDEGAFKLCVKSLDAISLILNGVDVSQETATPTFYEVVPNAVTMEGYDWSDKYFGYDPYSELPANNPVFYKVTDKTAVELDGNGTLVYKKLTYETKTLPNIQEFGGYSLGNLVDYKSDVTNTFAQLDQKKVITTNFIMPYDYAVFQISGENFGVETNEGKTKYYGLPYVSATINSNGVLIDYIGSGSYSDEITVIGRVVSQSVLNPIYNIQNGIIYADVTENGMVYKYKLSASSSVLTTFERMNFEMVYNANKCSAMISLDKNSRLMNINTLYKQNVFSFTTASAKQFLIDCGLMNIDETPIYNAYTNDLYDEFGLRSYSSFPVSTICVDDNNIGLAKLREVGSLLQFDYYLSENNTFLVNNAKLVDKIKFTNVSSFEEIIFANLIYTGGIEIVDNMISDLSKQTVTNEIKTTINYLKQVKENIATLLNKLNKIYSDIDAEYLTHIDASTAAFETLKPKLLDTGSVNDYALKVRKIDSVSTLNQFLIQQYRS